MKRIEILAFPDLRFFLFIISGHNLFSVLFLNKLRAFTSSELFTSFYFNFQFFQYYLKFVINNVAVNHKINDYLDIKKIISWLTCNVLNKKPRMSNTTEMLTLNFLDNVHTWFLNRLLGTLNVLFTHEVFKLIFP